MRRMPSVSCFLVVVLPFTSLSQLLKLKSLKIEKFILLSRISYYQEIKFRIKAFYRFISTNEYFNSNNINILNTIYIQNNSSNIN